MVRITFLVIALILISINVVVFASDASENIEDAKNVYPEAVKKVEGLQNGDPNITVKIQNILRGPDPFISIAKYLYDGVEKYSKEPKDTKFPKRVYDFIIVGAGTAGCVLANRLTEIKGWKVLLIEAGDHEFYYMDIPLLSYYLQQSSVDWQYATEPSDNYCTGYKNNACLWPRGKVVGGTSVINQMIYARGNRHDFDNWANLGNDGWQYDNVLPYFKKIETFFVPKWYDPKYHGYDGYLSVEQTPYKTISGKAWIEAAQELGYKELEYNGKNQCGASFIQFSMANGTRHSASRAYLHSINKRKNLHILKNSLVTKLLFDQTGSRVVGVVYEKNGKLQKVYARREVILSAGALNTPQILMLSGIGPEKHLNYLGIEVKQDLPVGENLMDHITTPITFTIANHSRRIDNKTIITNLASTLNDFVRYHNGPLATTAVEAILFNNMEDKYNVSAWPDIELAYIATAVNAFDVFQKDFNYKDDIFNELYGPLADNATYTIFPTLLRPKSRGHVKLRNKDPKSKPVLVANYFDDAEDIEVLIKGINLSIEIAKQSSMKKVGTKLYDVPLKVCLENGPFGSNNYWECILRKFTQTFYHFCGTCKMGTIGDPESVVDSRLNVYNIDCLRVVDASIFPQIPCGHTNAATLMVAEKAADMIKEEWFAPI